MTLSATLIEIASAGAGVIARPVPWTCRVCEQSTEDEPGLKASDVPGVCADCRHDHFTDCEECGTPVAFADAIQTDDGQWACCDECAAALEQEAAWDRADAEEARRDYRASVL